MEFLPQMCEIDAFQYLQEKLCNSASLGQKFLGISETVRNFFVRTSWDLGVQEHPDMRRLKAMLLTN